MIADAALPSLVAKLIEEVLDEEPLKSPDTKLKTKQKQLVAIELRNHGYTYEQIGNALGCSITYVSKILKKALTEIIREPTEQMLELELNRLDELLKKPYAMALEYGCDKDVKSCLHIMERRAKLLGLDKMAALPAGATGGVLMVPGAVSMEEWAAASQHVHARYHTKPDNDAQSA